LDIQRGVELPMYFMRRGVNVFQKAQIVVLLLLLIIAGQSI
jgi:hypothetical protein